MSVYILPCISFKSALLPHHTHLRVGMESFLEFSEKSAGSRPRQRLHSGHPPLCDGSSRLPIGQLDGEVVELHKASHGGILPEGERGGCIGVWISKRFDWRRKLRGSGDTLTTSFSLCNSPHSLLRSFLHTLFMLCCERYVDTHTFIDKIILHTPHLGVFIRDSTLRVSFALSLSFFSECIDRMQSSERVSRAREETDRSAFAARRPNTESCLTATSRKMLLHREAHAPHVCALS